MFRKARRSIRNFLLSASGDCGDGSLWPSETVSIFPAREKQTSHSKFWRQVGLAHWQGEIFLFPLRRTKATVLIARALMVNPKIMVLDEPLSGVDEESRRSIADLLIQLTREQGLAVFFSSHDLEMVQTRGRQVSCVSIRARSGWTKGRHGCRL